MHEPKQSVAVVIRDDAGAFLVTLRPDDPADPLAGVWGLPAVTRRPGEGERQAAERVGPAKLGVRLAIGDCLGAKVADRADGALRLAEYEARITAGTPAVPQPGASVTQYAACRFTADPAVLLPAARLGSLCAQILLEHAGGRD